MGSSVRNLGVPIHHRHCPCRAVTRSPDGTFWGYKAALDHSFCVRYISITSSLVKYRKTCVKLFGKIAKGRFGRDSKTWTVSILHFAKRTTLNLILLQPIQCRLISVCIGPRLNSRHYLLCIQKRAQISIRHHATTVCSRSLSVPFDLILTLTAALCWIAESGKPHEVLINGLKRGVPPKHRSNPKFRFAQVTRRTMCLKLRPRLADLSSPRSRS